MSRTHRFELEKSSSKFKHRSSYIPVMYVYPNYVFLLCHIVYDKLPPTFTVRTGESRVARAGVWLQPISTVAILTRLWSAFIDVCRKKRQILVGWGSQYSYCTYESRLRRRCFQKGENLLTSKIVDINVFKTLANHEEAYECGDRKWVRVITRRIAYNHAIVSYSRLYRLLTLQPISIWRSP